MRSKRDADRSARLRESSERISDPATIEARLSGLSGKQQTLLMKLYRASRSRLTANELAVRRDLIQVFQDATADVESDVFRAFRGLGSDTWSLSSMRRIGRDQQLLYQIGNRLDRLGAEIDGRLTDGLLDQFKSTWVDGAYRLDVLTPPETAIRFGLLPDREIISMISQPWSGANFSQRLGIITDRMADDIKHQLAVSMASGEAWQDAARRVRSQMGTGGQRAVWRAEMIARTEMAHAQTMANAQLYDENADVIEDTVWVAHPGACEVCQANHGQPVSEVGYPPRDSHPNCVCDILAVPKSWGRLNADPGDFSIRPPARSEWARDNQLADRIDVMVG